MTDQAWQEYITTVRTVYELNKWGPQGGFDPCLRDMLDGYDPYNSAHGRTMRINREIDRLEPVDMRYCPDCGRFGSHKPRCYSETVPVHRGRSDINDTG